MNNPAPRMQRDKRNVEYLQSDLSSARRRWSAPPASAKVMMRWWWFGPAQNTTTIDAELQAMAAAGLGGVEVSVVYPFTYDNEARPYPYLSQEFLAQLTYAGQAATKLGLRFDVTLGGGWSYGGPAITPELAARYLRWHTVEVPPSTTHYPVQSADPHDELIAAYVGAGSLEAMPQDFVQVSPREGHIELPVSAGPRVVALAYSSLTGQQVKRAPIGGEGYLLDHYSAAAMTHHLEAVGEPLIAAAGEFIHAIFCDSLEVNHTDWTPALPAAFAKRYGYDLLDALPLLLTPRREGARDLRIDIGRLLTCLHEENFLIPLRSWAHEHGVLLRMQGYGQPPIAMSSYAHIDLVEGEGWHWDQFTATKWASSAAGHLEEAVVSAEAWTWVHSPSLRATPLDLQAEAHEHFLLGINQLIGHGWPSTPVSSARSAPTTAGDAAGPLLPAPGAIFYAAGDLSDQNPWWPVMPDLARYMARISAVLQLGRPVRQIGIHVPDSASYAELRIGQRGSVDLFRATSRIIGTHLPQALRRAGYDYQVLDDRMLTAPPPGLAAILDVTQVGDPQTVLAQLLADTPPNIQIRHPDAIAVQRRLADADLYFVANVGPATITDSVQFAGAHGRWEQWCPRTGKQVVLTDVGPEPNTFPLHLPPYSATIFVGHSGQEAQVDTAPAVSAPASADAIPVPLPAASSSIGLEWRTETGEPIAFPYTLDPLVSTPTTIYARLTEAAVAEIIAELEPANGAAQVWLEFGSGSLGKQQERRASAAGPSYQVQHVAPVGVGAQVFVNGALAGNLWAAPYRVEIGAALMHAISEQAAANRAVELRVVILPSGVGQVLNNPELVARQEALTARDGARFEIQDIGEVLDLPFVGLAHCPLLKVGVKVGPLH